MHELVSKNKKLLEQLISGDKYKQWFDTSRFNTKFFSEQKFDYFSVEKSYFSNRPYFWFKIDGSPAYTSYEQIIVCITFLACKAKNNGLQRFSVEGTHARFSVEGTHAMH